MSCIELWLIHLTTKCGLTIFGGGAHTPIRGQQQLKTKTDDGEKQQKHSKLSSKTSPKESSQAPAVPWLDQECPSDKERFIPPELSIWDYFIAKLFFHHKVEWSMTQKRVRKVVKDDDGY